MCSVVNFAGEAVEPVGEPVDWVRVALAWYVGEHQGGGTRPQKRKQAALFQLVSIDGWPPGEAARALGYTPVGQRLAVERVRLALEIWYAQQAARSAEAACAELAEDDGPEPLDVASLAAVA